MLRDGVRLSDPSSAFVADFAPKKLGNLLRRVRRARGLTQAQLAPKLGVDKNTLGSYEREERLADLEFLGRFAEVTEWDAGKLLEARLDASRFSPRFNAALKKLSLATGAAVAFTARRSGLSDADISKLQTAAYERNLDLDGLEREFGREYPGPLESASSQAVDLQVLAKVIERVEEYLRDTHRLDTPPERRAKMTAILYDYIIAKGTTEKSVMMDFLALAA